MRNSFIKNLILTSAILGMLLMPTVQPVRAQWLSFDATNFGTAVLKYTNAIQQYGVQVKKLATAAANYVLSAAQKFFAQSGYLKEYVLDPIAYNLAQKSIQNITKSTLNAINKGSDGNPSFVEDLQGSLKKLSDDTSKDFISSLSGSSPKIAVNEAFRTDIQTNLAHYAVQTATDKLKSTIDPNTYKGLTNASNNKGFTDNGGWNKWLLMTQNPANNPYGAYMLAQDALNQQVSQAQNTLLTQANWSGGIKPTTDPKTGKTTTPGTTVKTQLDTVLSSGIARLNNADEISEIVGKLLGGLVNKMLSKGGGGLKGLSTPQPGRTDGSYADQVALEQASPITVQMPPAVADPATGAEGSENQMPDTIATGTASQISTMAGGAQNNYEAASGFNQTVQNWSITQLEVRPWWELDIQHAQSIKYVDVKERPNVSSGASLGEFRVFVSKIPFSNQVSVTNTSDVSMISIDDFDPTTHPDGVSSINTGTDNFWASPIQTINADGKNNPTKILVNFTGQYIRIQRVDSLTRRDDANRIVPNKLRLQLASLIIYRNQPPIIKKKGPSPVNLKVGETYIESGVDVTDDTDPNPTIEIMYSKINTEDGTSINNVSVDTTIKGTYKATYIVTDSGGASSTTQRTIIVNDSSGGTVVDPNSAIDFDSLSGGF